MCTLPEERVFYSARPCPAVVEPKVTEDTSREITQILQNPDAEPALSEKLFPLVYQELRRIAAAQMARESPGQTLQPTALVHEAYLRLVKDAELKWDSRAHFFGAAARSMRQMLINRANQKKAVKHGGELARRELTDTFLIDEPEPEKLLALNAALEQLEEIDPRKGRIVMLRYFAGLSNEDTAKALEISVSTVKREWQFARTWLHREMTNADSDS